MLIKFTFKLSSNIINSLCSILCKLFQYLIVDTLEDKLKSNNYQFEYKEDHSTVICTFLALEVIQYYKLNNSNIFTLILDASKAFDTVVYSKLFSVLLDREICPFL